MCNQGSGELLYDVGQRLMDGVVGTNQEICANRFQLVGGGKHQLAYARPVVAVDAGHVVGQREGVHRDLGMCMQAQDRGALDADRAVAQGRAFRRAGDDADMPRCHDGIRCARDKSRACQLLYVAANGCKRRGAGCPRPREGLLTGATAGAQTWRHEPLFMPLTGPSHGSEAVADWGYQAKLSQVLEACQTRLRPSTKVVTRINVPGSFKKEFPEGRRQRTN